MVMQVPEIRSDLITTVHAAAAAFTPVDTKSGQKGGNGLVLLVLRIVTLMFLVAMLTIHVKSVRVFIWEQYVSGGLLLSYCITHLGLILCATTKNCHASALEAYFCSIGGVMFAVNAMMIYCRWRYADDLTRMFAELLATLGLKLKAQVMMKVFLSIVISIGLLCDVILCSITKFL